MYDKPSDKPDVNSARRELFVPRRQDFVNIPPTEDALTQHILRAIYQGAPVSGQALIPLPQAHLPSPSNSLDNIT
jgi:hypothetical protein